MEDWFLLYVLEADSPDRHKAQSADGGLPLLLSRDDATVDSKLFRKHLTDLALTEEWSLWLSSSFICGDEREWRRVILEQIHSETLRADLRSHCILAIGSSQVVVVELHWSVEDDVCRYRVARRRPADSPTCITYFGPVRWAIPRDDELFDVDEAAEMFYAWYRKEIVPSDRYVLKELGLSDG